MGRKKKLTERMEQAGDRARRNLTVKPLVEIYGTQRVLIEHHRGICRYGSEESWVNAQNGKIIIQGEGLNLARIGREQLVICGRIHLVRFCGREEA